jgi:hypothetical protein
MQGNLPLTNTYLVSHHFGLVKVRIFLKQALSLGRKRGLGKKFGLVAPACAQGRLRKHLDPRVNFGLLSDWVL